MRHIQEILFWLRKEFRSEWRERAALQGLLLYIVSSVMISYLSFSLARNQISPATWNTVFWIIFLFAALNAVAKSFVQERSGRWLYYYTLIRAENLILAKIIYNALLLWVIALVGYGLYSVVMGNPVQDQLLFVLNLSLGAGGMAATLSLVASIAAKTQNNATLMAVLSFPIILPLFLLLLRVSRNALDGLDWSASSDELLALLGLNLIVGALSYLLFPYLWRT